MKPGSERINMKNISRTEALQLSKKIMIDAEKERSDIATKEANIGTNFDIDTNIVFYEFLMSLGNQFMSSDVLSLTLGQTQARLVKRGITPEKADEAIAIIAKVLSSRRSKFTQDFMG